MRLGWISWIALALLVSCDEDSGPGPDDTTATGTTGMGGCERDADCENGFICQAASCVEPECTDQSHCEAGYQCSAGRCYEPYWVVGDGGTVLRAYDDHVELHPLGIQQRLRSIACLGADRAWIVGDEATVFATSDGGASWSAIALPTNRDLHDVAVAIPERVAIVGDGLLLWSDDGRTFTELVSGSTVLHGVATDGSVVLAVGASGRQLRWSDGALVESTIAAVDLLDVDLAAHASTAVAVGKQGTILWSPDGGHEWVLRPSTTTVDLWSVQVSSDGREAIAVGDGGAVVRLTEHTVEPRSIAAVGLRDVHIDGEGHGTMVGLGGAMFATDDFGKTLRPAGFGPTDLLGVDAIGTHHW